MVALLRARAVSEGDRMAYLFLADGEREEARLTYAELDRRARALASWLQKTDSAGERALLLYPAGLDFIAGFFGCLYAGTVAVPAYPPRRQREQPRLRAIARDARPSRVLTTAAMLARAGELEEEIPELRGARWLATDDRLDAQAEDWRDPGIRGDTTAFLQYTSGSTSTPKGVVVSHAQLLHNEEMIRRAFGQSAASVIVGWLPLYHDMGLIGTVLQPLYAGASCILMSPMAFLQRPVRWLQAMSRYRGTTSGGPNFAYELCAAKVRDEERRELDLSSWTVAFNGAEPVRAETLERFAAAFAPCGFRPRAFYPCYGLAEATLFVTGGTPAAGPTVAAVEAEALERHRVAPAAPDRDRRTARRLVGCGRPWLGQRIAIVDPETGAPCPPDGVGEIWVSGPSIAGGYWGRQEESAETFAARTEGEPATSWLRTGDLGFVQDGELFVTGRLKDLVILRGRNYYPQDIERAAEHAHPALRPGCGAAFSIEVEGEERLVVVHELERTARAAPDAVIAALRREVSREHEVQVWEVVLLRPGTLPKTTSGKVQRRRCRDLFLAGALAALARQRISAATAGELDCEALLALPPAERRPALEADLRGRAARALGMAPERLGAEAPLVEHGLDSLAGLGLKHEVEADLGVEVNIQRLLGGACLMDLAGEVLAGLAATGGGQEPLPAAPAAEAGLSYGQKALWFLNRLAPASSAYNLHGAARLPSGVDASALRQACALLLDRHPALRTAVVAEAGEPRPWVDDHAVPDWREEDATGWSEAELLRQLAAEAHRPFDLGRAPLLRLRLYRRGEAGSVLLLVVHHLAADFWSLAVLVRELGVLYDACRAGLPSPLPPLALTYMDHVRQKAALLAGPQGEVLWEHWRRRLDGTAPPFELPADRRRPAVQSYRGAVLARRLDAALDGAVGSAARHLGATPFSLLLAAFAALLSRVTGREDLRLGAPTAGRSGERWAGVVGYFVNPVVLTIDAAGGPSFSTLVARTAAIVGDALAHAELPFPLLAERLQTFRDPSRSPLFQVLFVLQRAPMGGGEGLEGFALGLEEAELRTGGLLLRSLAVPAQAAPFDLTLSLARCAGSLAAALQYATDLFDRATMARLMGSFEVLLGGALASPEVPFSWLPLLRERERHQLLEWNDTAADLGPDRCLHELIEEQAAKTPDSVAVVFRGETLSYGRLNGRSNRLAWHLRELGVGPEVRVGISALRSFDLLVGLLAILKAGGAYVPLDPSYPRERLSYLLADSSVPVLLLQEGIDLPPMPAEVRVEWLGRWASGGQGEASSRPEPGATPESLAYVIYTSGSTGHPKGAMNSHRGVVNRLRWMGELFPAGEEERVLQKTPFSFDVSVWELFWPLVAGGRLVLAEPGRQGDGPYLVETIVGEGITTVHFVPSMLREFVETPGVERCDRTLRRVIASGEALPWDLQESWSSRLRSPLFNLYGPTEAAVEVTWWRCASEDSRRTVPIGWAVPNTSLHVLDGELRPVPLGVAGELLIGGVQVARGYHGKPELTAERFIPDPMGGAGRRLYRTGDLARRRPDGALEFLGRLDGQVKVRGFRIEPGEIEAALVEHPAVARAVVTAREDVPGQRRLVAYVVTAATDGERHTDLREELREYLRARLPEHMIPAVFVELPALPLNANGKIDRRALPRPEAGRDAEPYEAPRDEAETRLAEIWRELLKVERVGIHDGFFVLGGDSILAMQVVRRANACGLKLTPQQVFQHQTVAGLAAVAVRETPAAREAAVLLDEPPSEEDMTKILAQIGRARSR